MRQLSIKALPAKLSEPSRTAELQKLHTQGWKLVDGRDAIVKSFLFKDFVASFSFMTAVAFKAEAMQHHPEWFNVYNRVDVTLSTHDCDGLSSLDVELAQYMDKEHAKFK